MRSDKTSCTYGSSRQFDAKTEWAFSAGQTFIIHLQLCDGNLDSGGERQQQHQQQQQQPQSGRGWCGQGLRMSGYQVYRISGLGAWPDI